MKKHKMITILFTVCLMVWLLSSTVSAANKQDRGVQKAPGGLYAKRMSESSIKVSWKKDKTAKKYIVYKYDHAKKKAVKIAATKKNYYLDKRLKEHRTHHYVVRSVGKHGRSELSYSVCCINWKNKNKKITNPKRVVLDHDDVQVSLFRNPKYRPSYSHVDPEIIVAKVYPEKKGKKPFNKNVRWFTTNKKIAVVKKDGTVLPIDSGKCYVYAKAQNGVSSKKIEVQVDDYALVDEFARPPEEELRTPTIETMAVILMEENREHLCRVVSFAAKQQDYFSVDTFYDETYKIDSQAGIPSDVMRSIEVLAKIPYELQINNISPGHVQVRYGIIENDCGTEMVKIQLGPNLIVEREGKIIKDEHIILIYGGNGGMDSTIAPFWSFRSEVYTGPIAGRYVEY